MNSYTAEEVGVYKKDGKTENCTSTQTRLLLFGNLFLMPPKLNQYLLYTCGCGFYIFWLPFLREK
jgi:hypothetical protein